MERVIQPSREYFSNGSFLVSLLLEELRSLDVVLKNAIDDTLVESYADMIYSLGDCLIPIWLC